MPHRDIIHYETDALSGAEPETALRAGTSVVWAPKAVKKAISQPAALSPRGYFLPSQAVDLNARNPARLMRGPADHQADSQASTHQAR